MTPTRKPGNPGFFVASRFDCSAPRARHFSQHRNPWFHLLFSPLRAFACSDAALAYQRPMYRRWCGPLPSDCRFGIGALADWPTADTAAILLSSPVWSVTLMVARIDHAGLPGCFSSAPWCRLRRKGDRFDPRDHGEWLQFMCHKEALAQGRSPGPVQCAGEKSSDRLFRIEGTHLEQSAQPVL